MSHRIVFDTTVVVSALVFPEGRLAWLRPHWREKQCVPLISRATAAELTRVLGYPKFGLGQGDVQELLSDYIPYCKVIDPVEKCAVVCRDRRDQPFLDLAETGKADVLVSGDRDLLVLGGQTTSLIEDSGAYRRRISPEP